VSEFYHSSLSDLSKRGSAILARFAQFRPHRFLAYAFLAGGFSAGGAFDLDAINSITEKMLGRSTLGYWKSFDEEDAGAVIDSHVSYDQGF